MMMLVCEGWMSGLPLVGDDWYGFISARRRGWRYAPVAMVLASIRSADAQ
jgi:hypothetical protein